MVSNQENNQKNHKDIVEKFTSLGNDKFYNFLISLAFNVIENKNKDQGQKPPHMEYLELHDKFMINYRRDGNELFLRLANLFRKAAHKVYREMLKRNLITKNSEDFLNLV